MTCGIPVTERSARLTATGLPDLPLDGTNGLSLESLQIGFPGERPVVRVRSLADGVIDDTAFLGSRAVTISVRIASRSGTQNALDQLLPFMSPRYRTTLQYALAGDAPFPDRSLVLRGVDAPVVINGPSYVTIVMSWVSVGSYVRGAAEQSRSIVLTAEEEGRTYDLTFNRVYAGGGVAGSTTIVQNGNAPAQWRIVLGATATNPQFRINGVLVTTSANGGVSLAGTTTLNLDSLERTCLLDNDPAFSRYNRLNYTSWTWDDLLLQPGSNLVEYILAPGDESTMTIYWYDTWL